MTRSSGTSLTWEGVRVQESRVALETARLVLVPALAPRGTSDEWPYPSQRQSPPPSNANTNCFTSWHDGEA